MIAALPATVDPASLRASATVSRLVRRIDPYAVGVVVPFATYLAIFAVALAHASAHVAGVLAFAAVVVGIVVWERAAASSEGLSATADALREHEAALSAAVGYFRLPPP